MAKITKQDVWSAANSIDAAGDKPSVVEIRKRLGAGSYTTITNALREWQKPEESDESESLEVPDSVDEKASQFAADLYAIALEIAATSFEDEKSVLTAQISAFEAERDEAIKVSEIAENALESLRTENDELRGKLTQALADSKLWESRVGDLTMDKERALLDAATAREEVGALRGKLELLESMQSKASPKPKPAKVEKPAKQEVIAS